MLGNFRWAWVIRTVGAAMALMCLMTTQGRAQMTIYSDGLASGWQNYSWASTNFSNTSPVHSGSDSIAVTAGPDQALYFNDSSNLNACPYAAFTFWINGGATGGQYIAVWAALGGSAQSPPYTLGPLAANTWVQVTVPLSALGAAGATNLNGFWIQSNSGSSAPTFYVDDVSLTANNQIIYDDALENGYQSWSFNATTNFSNTSPIQSGSDSIAVTASGYGALYLRTGAFNDVNYGSLTFWINGGTGGQYLNVAANVNGNTGPSYGLGPLTANTWQQVTIPLSTLGAANQSGFDGFWIQNGTNSSIPTFYVDSASLTWTPPPSSVTVTANASAAVRTLDTRLHGVNTVMWDDNLTGSTNLGLLNAGGFTTLRWPGGSDTDTYNWSTNISNGNNWTWASGAGTFAQLLGSIAGSQAYITVNYGSGTPQMAEAEVAYFNASASNSTSIGVDSQGYNWQTVGYWASLRGASPLGTDDGYNFLRIAHPAGFGIKYYEVGNEVYGGWETDEHGQSGSGLTGSPHDPYTYGTCSAQFIAAMKAADSTIKVGVVAINGEDSGGNGSHAVPNPAEGNTLHSGWVPVMLVTMTSLGYVPDFLIYHNYPENPGQESDFNLLNTGANWAADASNFQTMTSNYLGSAGTGIELACTEVNSVNSSPGKQATSLVNGLFAADSFGSMAQTSFNACTWWCWRNGAPIVPPPTGTNMQIATLYGWREFGDFGMLGAGTRSDTPLNTGYPTYYANMLLSDWANGGDQIIGTSSTYPLLSVYGSQQLNGNLALLVINKSPSYSINGGVTLSGFTPGSGAAMAYSYGEANDAANGGVTTTSLGTLSTSFNYTSAPYSINVIVVPPVTQTIYSDSLQNGWENYSWASTNFSNTSPVHSGSDSIAVTASPFSALYFNNPTSFTAKAYGSFSFWINGGASGGQNINVYGILANNGNTPAVPIAPLAANTWVHITVPYATLGVAGGVVNGFWIQSASASSAPVFYVDDVQMTM